MSSSILPSEMLQLFEDINARFDVNAFGTPANLDPEPAPVRGFGLASPKTEGEPIYDSFPIYVVIILSRPLARWASAALRERALRYELMAVKGVERYIIWRRYPEIIKNGLVYKARATFSYGYRKTA